MSNSVLMTTSSFGLSLEHYKHNPSKRVKSWPCPRTKAQGQWLRRHHSDSRTCAPLASEVRSSILSKNLPPRVMPTWTHPRASCFILPSSMDRLSNVWESGGSRWNDLLLLCSAILMGQSKDGVKIAIITKESPPTPLSIKCSGSLA